MTDTSLPPPGHRGPPDHERRQQIIQAAEAHFRHYGFGKTTVADLARAIGLSTAYIYKFFDSKRAIGEAVCSLVLNRVLERARAIAAEPGSAADRLQRLFIAMAEISLEQYFQERRLHDMAVTACTDRWQSVADYDQHLQAILSTLIGEGRADGTFENRTPLAETSLAITLAMASFLHPLILEERRDQALNDAALLARLVLRSLAP